MRGKVKLREARSFGRRGARGAPGRGVLAFLGTLGWAAVLLCVTACAVRPGIVLDLHDPRLPVEARRWLADAEDEVVIASARVDLEQKALVRLEAYRVQQDRQLTAVAEGADTEGRRRSAARLKGLMLAYTESRIGLQEITRRVARDRLELARARLILTRAETAMRYDLAVYEVETVAQKVAALREKVAGAQGLLEAQRAQVDQAAGQSWLAYAAFVGAGGQTQALWVLPRVN